MRPLVPCLAAIVHCALGAGYAQDQPPAETPPAERPVVAIDSQSREYLEGGDFRTLTADLEREGLEVTTTRKLAGRARPEITATLLEDVDVLITDQRDAFAPRERKAIREWVDAGGGLLVLCEFQPGLPLGFGYEALLADYKITVRPGQTGRSDYTDRTHPIMQDVRTLEDVEFGTDLIAPRATVLAEIRTHAIAVARESKQGRLVACDRSLFQDPRGGREYIEEEDNRLFATDTVRWLAKTLERP
jgi:hypothetical protein